MITWPKLQLLFIYIIISINCIHFTLGSDRLCGNGINMCYKFLLYMCSLCTTQINRNLFWYYNISFSDIWITMYWCTVPTRISKNVCETSIRSTAHSINETKHFVKVQHNGINVRQNFSKFSSKSIVLKWNISICFRLKQFQNMLHFNKKIIFVSSKCVFMWRIEVPYPLSLIHVVPLYYNTGKWKFSEFEWFNLQVSPSRRNKRTLL